MCLIVCCYVLFTGFCGRFFESECGFEPLAFETSSGSSLSPVVSNYGFLQGLRDLGLVSNPCWLSNPLGALNWLRKLPSKTHFQTAVADLRLFWLFMTLFHSLKAQALKCNFKPRHMIFRLFRTRFCGFMIVWLVSVGCENLA